MNCILQSFLALLFVVDIVGTAEASRVVGLSGADRRAGRQLYAEDRKKSLCADESIRRQTPLKIGLLKQLLPTDKTPSKPLNITEAMSDGLLTVIKFKRSVRLCLQLQLWNDGVVPYALSHQFSAKQRARIAEAIDFFKADSCVHWTSRTTERDYVLFTLQGRGCTADVGRQGGRQIIVLGDTECFNEVGNVLQLMLHVVGLYHEHQKVDRDQWLSVNFENIPPRLHRQFWKIRTNISALDETQYDFASLTHFGMSDQKEHPMFRPKVDGFQSVMGQRNHFSQGDIKKLHRLYPCTEPPTAATAPLTSAGNTVTITAASTTTSATSTSKPPTTATNAGTKPVSIASHRCILLIGGYNLGSTPSIEYYHPTEDECDASIVGKMSTSRANETDSTSGCYLSETDQIVVRESRRPNSKPPMLYGVQNQLAKKLPFPYTTSAGSPTATCCSTTAAISPTQCLSCGMWTAGPSRDFNNCYQFNTSSDRWTQIPPLPLSLSSPTSVALNPENYYVVGGVNRTHGDLKEMHRYSVSERRWHQEPPMSRGRHYHSAAVLSPTEFIVCGGESGRRECEVFNATKRSWRSVGNLNTGRYNFVMVSFNGRVYALAGSGPGTTARYKSVEVYDAQTESWTKAKSLKHRRELFVAVVV